MIRKFQINSQGCLVDSKNKLQVATWIDVVNPTMDETTLLEQSLNIKIPEHQELMQLEYSNRYYEYQNALYLSTFVVTKVSPLPISQVVLFILTDHQLITVRYSELSPIKSAIEHFQQHSIVIHHHLDIFFMLLDHLIGAAADIFEFFEEKTESISLTLSSFKSKMQSQTNQISQEIFNEIIHLQSVLSKCYQSLSSLQLLIGYFKPRQDQYFKNKITKSFDILSQDIIALVNHGEFLTQKLEFQLDSALGIINIEQNQIIKTFTILALIFMPPTLIASVYGMNFKHMPELFWGWGYPLAIGLMIGSAIVPYYVFKRKKWL